MTLRDLQPGDRFVHAADKNKHTDVYQVAGDKCEFNRAAGTATRKCIDPDGQVVDKQCKLEVRICQEPVGPIVEVKHGEGKQQNLF